MFISSTQSQMQQVSKNHTVFAIPLHLSPLDPEAHIESISRVSNGSAALLLPFFSILQAAFNFSRDEANRVSRRML